METRTLFLSCEFRLRHLAPFGLFRPFSSDRTYAFLFSKVEALSAIVDVLRKRRRYSWQLVIADIKRNKSVIYEKADHNAIT